MPMSSHHQPLALPAHPADGTELTLSVLGCGTMGIAILSGILSSLSELNGPKPLQSMHHHGTSDPLDDPLPDRLPSRFIACVRCPESAKRVKKALWEHSSFVKVAQNDNVAAVKQSEVVILACKPSMISSMLSEPGLAKALRGKLLISIAAGVKVEQIEAILKEADNSPATDHEDESRCRVVRAIPNTAAKISESMTVVALPDNPPLSPQAASLVTWVFRRIGDVVYLPPNNMDASTALAGAGPAFFALMLESAIDGAVAMGLPRREATRMAAQAMRGTATMVQSGEHPAILREKNTTPGGCTIGGLLVLEEGGVRGTVSRAVREATVVASQLGKGTENVNGTRFYADNGGF